MQSTTSNLVKIDARDFANMLQQMAIVAAVIIVLCAIGLKVSIAIRESNDPVYQKQMSEERESQRRLDDAFKRIEEQAKHR